MLRLILLEGRSIPAYIIDRVNNYLHLYKYVTVDCEQLYALTFFGFVSLPFYFNRNINIFINDLLRSMKDREDTIIINRRISYLFEW